MKGDLIFVDASSMIANVIQVLSYITCIGRSWRTWKTNWITPTHLKVDVPNSTFSLIGHLYLNELQ